MHCCKRARKHIAHTQRPVPQPLEQYPPTTVSPTLGGRKSRKGGTRAGGACCESYIALLSSVPAVELVWL